MLGKGLASLIPPKKSENKESGIRNQEIGTRNQEPVGAKAVASTNASDTAISSPSSFPPPQPPPIARSPKFQKFPKPESIFHIEVEKIKPNPYQPRRHFDEENLKELAQSIREVGILQPLVVSKIIRDTETGTRVEYQLIAGERRLLAAKILGLERVPAVVKKVDLDRSKLEMALIENIQRSNLNPLEAARAYARLQDEFSLTQREIAARVGKSREAIANTLRLLQLPSHIQDALSKNQINESQARTLLAVEKLEDQNKVFSELVAQKMSVRELKAEVSKPKIIDPEQQFLEKELEERLGAPVKVIRYGARGKIVIRCQSEDEWRGLLARLLGETREG
jgi:ParB family chromosome partitioning protein